MMKTREISFKSSKNAHLKEPERRTPVEPQCLGQDRVEGGVVLTELLSQRLLSLDLVEKGGTPGRRSPCSSCETTTTGAGGGAGRRSFSVMHRSLRHHAAVGARSGASPDDPLDRPLLGAESPAARTSTVSRPPADRLPERARLRPW
jgi:hypothetical protein